MDGLLPLPPLLVHIKLVLVHSKGVPCIPSDPTPDNAAIIQTMAPPHNNEALPPADRILRVSKSSILDGRDCATLNAADEHRKETVVASSKSESKVQVSDARRREPTAFLSVSVAHTCVVEFHLCEWAVCFFKVDAGCPGSEVFVCVCFDYDRTKKSHRVGYSGQLRAWPVHIQA